MKLGGIMMFGLVLLFLTNSKASAETGAAREVTAVRCSQGSQVKLSIRSTERLPGASGKAGVERRGGTTRIEVRLEGMKPAWLFGGDYNTYVLWVVSPGRRAENLGEMALDGSRSTRRVSIVPATIGLLVTAEPHYLVQAPSSFVVLESRPEGEGENVRYPVVEGEYNFERSRLSGVLSARGAVNTEVRQAFAAYRLAQRAGAKKLAATEFEKAEQALDQMLTAARQGLDRNHIVAQALHALRLALAAQHRAEERALQSARVP